MGVSKTRDFEGHKQWIKHDGSNTTVKKIDFDLDCALNILDSYITTEYSKLDDVNHEVRSIAYNRDELTCFMDRTDIDKQVFKAIGAIEALWTLELEIVREMIGEDNIL